MSFLIGCAATFERALRVANVSFRFLGAHNSSIRCIPAGRFRGHMVVSCRAFKNSNDAVKAIQVSSRHLLSHGPPVHVGDPAQIGIKDLYNPDVFSVGPIAPLSAGEIVMYWGCGITPQTIAVESKIPFMITHCPDHMFVTDKLYEELASC